MQQVIRLEALPIISFVLLSGRIPGSSILPYDMFHVQTDQAPPDRSSATF